MHSILRPLAPAALLLALASPHLAAIGPQETGTQAEEATTLYWDLPLAEVPWREAPEEATLRNLEVSQRGSWWDNPCRIALDGVAEGYLFSAVPTEDEPEPTVRLVVAAPPGPVTGAVYVNRWRNGELEFELTLQPGQASAEARGTFLAGRAGHHRRNLNQRLPGGAWWRAGALEGVAAEEGEALPLVDVPPRNDAGEFDETLQLFGGGRAVSENLQLDRLLPPAPVPVEGEAPPPDVLVDGIPGIELPEFDWTPLLAELEGGAESVTLDPLLAWVPHDQHVLTTPSFRAFLDLVDELERRASPLVQMMEADASSANSRRALETQLALSLDGLARLLGPALIDAVAITGGDLYMRVGTDVTLLFACRDAAPVVQHIRRAHEGALSAHADAERTVEGAIEGVSTPDGGLRSFFTVDGSTVLVSNSRASLARSLGAPLGRNLAQLDETRFFRSRYRIGGDEAETAFALISDATIRRWCGARWRLGASRRLRAQAALYELHARHAGELARGVSAARELRVEDPRFPDLGRVLLTPNGVASSVYGSIGRMTPIAELEFTTVPAQEARAYERWRDGYARNWSGAFDPIAARLVVDEERLEGDLTVLPLIDNTDYQELRSVSRDARLGPLDGDPHAGTLFHFALAIDPTSPTVLEFQELLAGFAPGEVSNVLGWMSGAISIFADEDEVWENLFGAQDFEEALEDLLVEFNELPIGITIGSNSPLKLAGWMTALRGFAEGSAPGLVSWVPKEDEAGNRWVRVGGENLLENDEHLLYATLRDALVFSINEACLLRTLERFRARREAESATPSDPGWLGESAALRISSSGVALLATLFGDDLGREAQQRTYENLPILNEWRRLFPDEDPVEVHRRILGQELRCAAGGTFVWDEEWRTMSSTALGHPAARKPAPNLPPELLEFDRIDAGLTFELDGLRARVRVNR